jgi:lipid II:glycine glycyltransferase (peptidoglycan interpeptide bridge formation enzyme)
MTSPTVTFQTITPSPQQWDQFVNQQPRAHVLQQSAWGELKRAYGWDCERIALANGDQIIAGAQILFRPLPMRLGTVAYLPMGFYLQEQIVGADGGAPLSPALWQSIDARCRRRGCAFLKWEPGIYLEDPAPDFDALGFKPSPQTIQPPRTIVIDISADDETILARMNQGTRRKFRQSQKNDVRYSEAARAEVEKFTRIMQVTGSRNEFGVHEPAYYQLAYDLFVPSGDAALILAEHEGDVLAGIMVFARGDWAWYLYGASSNEKRSLMASYGVQWAAIQWAKQRGCKYYDLWGVPDEDKAVLEAQFENRSDGLWGVYGFKRGWGGRLIRSAGAWDKVYNPLIYSAYKLALKVRNRDSALG